MKRLLLLFLLAACSSSGLVYAQSVAVAVNDTVVVRDTKERMCHVLLNDGDGATSVKIVEEPKGKASVRPERGMDRIFYSFEGVEGEEDVLTYETCVGSKCEQAKLVVYLCPKHKGGYPTIEKALLQRDEPLDFDYPGMAITLSKKPEWGEVSISADKSKATFTPPKGELGSAAFKLLIQEDKGYCGMVYHNTFEQRAYVLPSDAENKPPVAVTDTIYMKYSSKIEIDVLANDYDPEGSLKKKIVKLGKSKLNAKMRYTPKKVTYTPPSGFKGQDSFSYTICDLNEACTEGKVIIIKQKR